MNKTTSENHLDYFMTLKQRRYIANVLTTYIPDRNYSTTLDETSILVICSDEYFAILSNKGFNVCSCIYKTLYVTDKQAIETLLGHIQCHQRALKDMETCLDAVSYQDEG